MSTARTRLRPVAVAGGAAALVLLAAPGAHAGELTGGTTSIRLDAATARALTGAGVQVSAVAGARASGATVRFPITGGLTSPELTIGHRGALQLQAGRTRVRLSRPRITAGESRVSLSVQLAGRRTTVARLSGGELEREGQELSITGASVRLTAGAARALNRAFGVSLLRSGTRLGAATVAGATDSVPVTGGTTSLVPDPATASTLTSAGVSLEPVTPSTLDPARGVLFPILDGELNPDTLRGALAHDGGLRLRKASGETLELTDFGIELDAGPSLFATAGGERAEVAHLRVTGTPALSATRAQVPGVEVRLSPAGAAAVSAFVGATVPADTLLGVAAVDAELG